MPNCMRSSTKQTPAEYGQNISVWVQVAMAAALLACVVVPVLSLRTNALPLQTIWKSTLHILHLSLAASSFPSPISRASVKAVPSSHDLSYLTSPATAERPVTVRVALAHDPWCLALSASANCLRTPL